MVKRLLAAIEGAEWRKSLHYLESKCLHSPQTAGLGMSFISLRNLHLLPTWFVLCENVCIIENSEQGLPNARESPLFAYFPESYLATNHRSLHSPGAAHAIIWASVVPRLMAKAIWWGTIATQQSLR